MRILVKLAVRRQTESVAISRTRLSDTGQVGTGFDSIGYGPDLSGTVAFGAVAVQIKPILASIIPNAIEITVLKRLVRPMMSRVQLGFDVIGQTLDRDFDP